MTTTWPRCRWTRSSSPRQRRHDRGDHAAGPLQPEPRRPAARRRRGRAAGLQGHARSARPSGTTSRRRSTAASQLRATRLPGGRRASTSGTRTDSKITRLVDCSANAGVDDLLLDVNGKKNYTIQVGGVGGAGGPIDAQGRLLPRHRRRRRPRRPARQVPDRPGHRALRRLPAGAEGRAEHRLRRHRRAASRSSA